MKKQLILAALATATIGLLPACTTVEQTPAPQTHTSSSTTTETSVHRPVSTSVESTSVRSY